MKLNQFALAGLVLVALLAGFYLGSKSVPSFGGSSQVHTNLETFASGIVVGGAPVTVSGTTSTSITAAEACGASNLYVVTPSITAASTFTLPTASAMFTDCLQNNGDSVRFFVRNTTASTTVVTANTSSTVVYDGATGGSATLAASSYAELRLLRISATSMIILMNQFKP